MKAAAKGIGFSLIADAEARAIQLHARVAQCTIRVGNEPSERLFRKRGYVPGVTFFNARSGNQVTVYQKTLVTSTYTFGGRTFTSRDKVRLWMGEIRADYVPGETITDAGHVRAVTDLLQCHVDGEQKIGAGIKRLFVDYAPDHPSLCFWVERVDGVKTDFGVAACLQGIGMLNRQSFRQAIRPVIDAFRQRRIGDSLTFVSDFSGKPFSITEAHVDHEIPFADIITSFANAEDISVETQLLTMSRDACSVPVWIDAKLPRRFLKHHAQYPLRLVHRRENLSDIKLQTNRGEADIVSPRRRRLILRPAKP